MGKGNAVPALLLGPSLYSHAKARSGRQVHKQLRWPQSSLARSLSTFRTTATHTTSSTGGSAIRSCPHLLSRSVPPCPNLRRFSTSSHLSSQHQQRDMDIRPVQEADREEWLRMFRLYTDFYRTSVGSVPPSEEQNVATWRRAVDPAGDVHALLLRDETGRVIGMANYVYTTTPWSEKKICYLSDLYIDSEIRGKGYGRAMINAVHQAAKKEDALRVEWVTRHENTTAMKLYDKLAASNFVQYRMAI